MIDPQGRVRGGPMYYIEKGLGQRWLGLVFALFASISAFGIGNMVQSNSVASAVQASFGVPTWVSGLVLMVATALVVLGFEHNYSADTGHEVFTGMRSHSGDGKRYVRAHDVLLRDLLRTLQRPVPTGSLARLSSSSADERHAQRLRHRADRYRSPCSPVRTGSHAMPLDSVAVPQRNVPPVAFAMIRA